MKYTSYWIVPLLLLLSSCVESIQKPIYTYIRPDDPVDYYEVVRPILEKRCVVCHSCYNAPCQLKFSSWEGIDRGASKKEVYDSGRLHSMEPSRLFIDANTTAEWREKGFFSVKSENGQSYDQSILYQILDHKRTHPVVDGEYKTEDVDLTCAQNEGELNEFLEKHPNRGMPFGFPPLSHDHFNKIMAWLHDGANGPDDKQKEEIESVPKKDQAIIDKWEEFLNKENPKHRMTARYLYEHLFLAHLNLNTGSGNFYEIVRSVQKTGEKVKRVIATVRPYDNPGEEKFYYRIRKITSAIVFKTHMVFPFGTDQFNRVDELFITPEWYRTPMLMGYDKKDSANPFITFEQIPIRSRYQWLLDNAQYVIMTFIRGPVCKGQVALNVVNDQFWLLFMDPDYDLSISNPEFIQDQEQNLKIPGDVGKDYKITKAFFDPKHNKMARKYFKARQKLYDDQYPNGLSIDAIWKGRREDDQPLLTVFRHFDSASVHRGPLGNLPKTAWVLDYPALERIYYALVASFDVYGTKTHQLATRRYMDALRIECETMFLDFMPKRVRKKMMDSWNRKLGPMYRVKYKPMSVETGVNYQKDYTKIVDFKREFLERIVNGHLEVDGISFDHNYLAKDEEYPLIPDELDSLKKVLKGFVAISKPGVSFFHHMDDHNANVAWVKIENIPGWEDQVISIIVNRYHYNVRYIALDDLFLNPKKDRAVFKEGFIGSYPNYFFVVDYKDLRDFLEILDNFDGSEKYIKELHKYGINRANKKFWEVFDWFQDEFYEQEKEKGGVIDLNRYFHFANEELQAP